MGDTPQMRQEKVLDAAQALALRGGYRAVRMRDVAEQIGVSIGTVYRDYPSKIHLLVALTEKLIGRAGTQALTQALRALDTATPAERLRHFVDELTNWMQRIPNATEAMAKSLFHADRSAAPEVTRAFDALEALLIQAMRGTSKPVTDASVREMAIARIVADVWLATLLKWLSGRASSHQMVKELDETIDLLLGRPTMSSGDTDRSDGDEHDPPDTVDRDLAAALRSDP